MTKEKLKKKLEKKAEKECVLNDRIHIDCFVSGYLKGALPREKRIEKLEKENAELEQQIEKMKCCENCKYYNPDYDDELCKDCFDKEWKMTNWELKEND